MPKKAKDDANEALRQRRLEDAAAHGALASAQQMAQRAAAKKWKREGGNKEVGR
jgi:hypothetical protein